MRKTAVIAVREYLAVVRTKAFVVGLILLPVMMAGPGLVARATSKVVDVRDRRFAVIDRTPGAVLFPAITTEVAKHNDATFDRQTQRQVEPKFVLEQVAPAPLGDATTRQRLELSDRVRKGELFGVLEIGADVLNAPPPTTAPAAGENPSLQTALGEASTRPDEQVVRYQTNSPTYVDFRRLADVAINRSVRARRLVDAGVPTERQGQILQQVPMVDRGLTRRMPSGQLRDGERAEQIATFAVPIGLVLLMFIVVVIGAIPLTQGIVEEKQQRIAEVLLGSATPFQLMCGKVLGMVGTSMTLITVYLAAGYFGARRYGVSDFLQVHVMVWFVIFQLLAVLMYGSMYIAIGAACTDSKELQSLILPVNLLMIVPLTVMGNVITNPNGPLARLVGLFPPATPMIAVARIAIPPGISALEIALAVAIMLVSTIILIWISGRIFRVGILMQGKGANIRDLMRWVVTG